METRANVSNVSAGLGLQSVDLISHTEILNNIKRQ